MMTSNALPTADPQSFASDNACTVQKEKVLAIMSSRCPASSLESFLGTYRIVWDSESNFDPRDVLLADIPGEHHPDDGYVTLSRPQRAQGWPKEPTPSSHVVIRLCDAFLGTNRTASVLKPSPRPTPVSSSASSSFDAPLFSPSSASRLSPSDLASPSPFCPSDPSSPSLVSLVSPTALGQHSPSISPTPGASPLPSSNSLLSADTRSRSRSSSASSRTEQHTRRFWRFDWDPAFPRLGFRFEGMDLTAPTGHALSFSRIRDDRGHPFAIVDLRPSGWRDGGGKAHHITVVAKRVPDRYVREGLSDTERERLGMIELEELYQDFDTDTDVETRSDRVLFT